MEIVKLKYLDQENIKVDFQYSEKIKNLVKKAGTARWNPEDKFWSIHKSRVSNLVNILKEERIALKLDLIIQKELNLNQSGKTKEEEEALLLMKKSHPSYAIKGNIDTSYLNFNEGFDLYPYQNAGLEYALQKNGRILLGDDMGLGKTAQCIAIAQHYKREWPLMVIAPASLILNWKKELLMWLKDLNEEDITVIKKGKDLPKGKITIGSYDYAIKQKEAIEHYLGVKGVLIVDEAHNIKNPEAQKTKAVISISHAAKRCVITTGTPFLSRPIEIWPLLYSIYPNHPEWSNENDFAVKYCEGRVIKIGKKRVFDKNGASNMEEFHDLVRDTIMIRRLKTDDGVLDQLPPKRRVTQYIETDEDYINDIQKIKADLESKVIEYYRIFNGNIGDLKRHILSESSSAEEGVFKAYNLAGLSKVDGICDWIKEKFDEGMKKLIVFGHHKNFLDAISDTLNTKKIKYMRIDGTTPKKKRFEYTEAFQNDDSIQVAVLSINAASVGLTLTSASDVLIGEMPWTPALAQQAECRAHRNGQKESVTCYYAIANGTFDGALWNKLSKKSATSNTMLDGGFGDEMEDEISFSTNDIVDAVILNIHEKIEKGVVTLEELENKQKISVLD